MCAINLVYQADSSYNSLTFFFSVLSLFDCCFRFLRSLLLFASPLLLKERSIFYFLCFLFRVVFVVWLLFVYFVVVVGLLLLLLLLLLLRLLLALRVDVVVVVRFRGSWPSEGLSLVFR